jgi:hypothetical protein
MLLHLYISRPGVILQTRAQSGEVMFYMLHGVIYASVDIAAVVIYMVTYLK